MRSFPDRSAFDGYTPTMETNDGNVQQCQRFVGLSFARQETGYAIFVSLVSPQRER